MTSVTPDLKSRLSDFAHSAMLAGLEIVQQCCEREGLSTWIITDREDWQNLDPLSDPTRWWMGALRVQLPSQSGAVLESDEGHLYLVVEGVEQGDGIVRGLSSVFYAQGSGCGLQCLTYPVEDIREKGLMVQPVDVLTTFMDCFEAFKADVLVTQMTPQPAVNVEGTPPAIAEPPVSVVLEPVEDSLIERMRASRRKAQVLQREETEVFLSCLKLKEGDFKHQGWMDLERGSALSRKVMGKRPLQGGEYQRSYDVLMQQAMGFAWSLSPVSLSEFADYFEIYWTMAEFDCASHQGMATDEAAFIAQVQVLAEQTDTARQMRSLVRSIELKLGRPDELGRRDWIGFSNIDGFLPMDERIEMIQVRSTQRLVRFEYLSWAVLQVYQNAGYLPRSEQNLGRNLVLSFMRSARHTIEEPTEAVICDASNVEYFEVQFVRRVMDEAVALRAIALVRVGAFYGRVVLHSYRFEEV